MSNRKTYAVTALILVVAALFDVWWFSLPGFWHWQGGVACIGLFAFGWMAEESWQRSRAS